MKVLARRFNIYLVLAALLALACGCQTDKKTRKSAPCACISKPIPTPPAPARPISVLRSDPVLVTIKREPILTEANIVAAKVIDAPGGFAIEIKFDENGTWMLEQYSAANPGRHFVIFGQWGDKLGDGRWLAAPLITRRISNGVLAFTPDCSREEADQLVLGLNNVAEENPQRHAQMIFPAVRRAIFSTRRAVSWGSAPAFSAQTPFQFPTANHALFEPGDELKFFAPTAPDKPWTTGSFGCVRTDGRQMHEGLDIRCLQRDRHGEPTDPVMATADGTVVYFSTKPSLSNYGKYIVIRHIVEGVEIYSLYAHLSEIQPGLAVGKPVKAGEVIATMGRTSNTGETITKDRAHVHFELNVFVNEGFAGWYKKTFPNQRNDHGIWNGQNLNGLDPREILLAEHNPAAKFSLLNFLRSQTELCRVFVRATNFPYLKRYPMLVLSNPTAAKGRRGRL